jgi:plastocyanin
VRTAPRWATVAAAAVAVLAVVVFLTARSASGGEARPDGAGVLEVEMADYLFVPERLVVPAGEPVSIRFVNRDEASHHVTLGREVLVERGREVGYAEDLLDGLDATVHPSNAMVELTPAGTGTAVLIPGGREVTLDVTIPEDRVGTWEVGCFTGRGAHYMTGMHVELEVEGA